MGRRSSCRARSWTLAGAKGLKAVTLGFRPEDLSLTEDTNAIPVEVLLVEELGADAYVYGQVTGQRREPPDRLPAPTAAGHR